MKESIRAAEDLRLHKRLLAVIEDNVSEEQADRIRAVRRTRKPTEVAMLEEKRVVVEILEENPPKKRGRPKSDSSKKSDSSSESSGGGE